MKAKKTAAYVMLCFVISVFLLVTGTIAFAENDILYIGDGVGLGQEEKIVFKTGYGQAEILADTNNGWFRFGTPTLPMGANFMGSLIFGGSLQQNISSPVGGTLKLFSRDEMDIWADKIYLSAGSALQGPDDVNTKVGMGTANPSSMIEISGTNSNADLRLTRINNVSPGSEMGKLTFLAPNASGISRDWAQLRVVVENATANSESAGLAFNTRNGDNSFPERVRIDGKGNVGIGTSNPFAILNLYTNGTSSKSTAGNKDQRLYMQLGSIQSVNDGSEIVFGMQDVGSGRYAAIGTDVKATGLANQISGDIYLATKSLVTDTALTRRMVIQANGNVGIGTTSPNEKLHLYGTSNTFAHIEGGPATTSNGIKMTTNGNIMFVSNENGRMGFFNTSSERMSILNNGNVGIGTITPGQRLDVAGNIKGNALCIGTDCRSSWPVSQNGSGNVGIGTTSPAAKLEIAGIAGTNYSDSTSAGLFVSGTGHNRVQLSTTSTS
ncbi:MAG: hypothetical protein HY758_03965 [Nitrospirae bacterium]|nr:hypothetical protein [Nitrospirota bacterium]